MTSKEQYPQISVGDHSAFMEYAAERARLSPSSPDKYCVGSVLVDGDTGTIIATGFSLECHGDMLGDIGNTHAEQCCFIKVAQQNGLSPVCAEKHIAKVLPRNTLLYTTMEPCNQRDNGARVCCDRIIALKGIIRTVFVGIGQPPTFHINENGKQKLETEGIGFVVLKQTQRVCYEAAIARHEE